MQRVARVSEEQAALLASTLENQHAEIARALRAFARKLRFREEADDDVAGDLERPDVLAVMRRGGRDHLFVGIARAFTEPVHDVRHHEIVRAWMRRFAQLTSKQTIAGGYVMVGAFDDASAAVWACVLTQMAGAHRLQRDGERAKFVVQRLGSFWGAC
jgi:hypothetical protein